MPMPIRKVVFILFCVSFIGLFNSRIYSAHADIEDILVSPKTPIDRAIEARSTADIIKDNEIIISVNKAMVKLKTYRPSTEIYEQNLIITGLLLDKETHDSLKQAVNQIPNIKQVYWHADYSSNLNKNLINQAKLEWNEILALRTEIKFNLIRTKGIADVNFRVSVDVMGNAYILGRARSEKERNRVLRVANNTQGIKKVVNYIVVRP